MIGTDALFAAILAKAKALAPLLDPPVSDVREWTGEEPCFNPDAVFPSLALQYLGGDSAPRGQIRGVSYQAGETFAVHISTQDTAARTAGSQGRTYLDALELGLQGWLGDTGVALRRHDGSVWGPKRQSAVLLDRQTHTIVFRCEQSFHLAFD